MIDQSRRDDLGIDECHAADDAIALKAINDAVFRVDPVLQGENDRAIRDHRLDLRQDLVQIIRLDGENDQIRCGQFPGVSGRSRMHRHGARGAADGEPLLPDGRQGVRPQQK